jgi:hypothetical protein
VLDRHRGAIARDLEQLDVLRREATTRQRADVQDADRARPDEEWNAEQRRHPALVEERVDRVARLQLVDDHRLAARRHGSGEPGAHRKPETALHLLLEPARSPCYQLVAAVIDQKDRDRVDVEDGLDPVEKGSE